MTYLRVAPTSSLNSAVLISRCWRSQATSRSRRPASAAASYQSSGVTRTAAPSAASSFSTAATSGALAPADAGSSATAGGALRDRLAAELARGGLTPPRAVELPALVGASPDDVAAVLKLLAADGRAVRVSAELWYDGAAVAGLRARLVAWAQAHGGITTQEFKELVGATRKHVIPLAEYFDRERVTLRVGERRVLRGGRA